jgi:acetyl esterase/lipase
LISLHGGSYNYSSGGQARLIEAIPVAGYGRIKVVSVDYRLSPKYKFPAAAEDAVAVYRELLKTYNPQNIGIYGCSTGATLTAVVVARIQKDGLPRPGAIQDDHWEGDSYYIGPATMAGKIPRANEPSELSPYMVGTDPHDPSVAPVVSLDVLSRFPPTLLISGTRDVWLSSVLYTHSRLVKTGVDADLHIWDGLWHAFYFDVTLPESKEAYDVIIRFFEKHLGRK